MRLGEEDVVVDGVIISFASGFGDTVSEKERSFWRKAAIGAIGSIPRMRWLYWYPKLVNLLKSWRERASATELEAVGIQTADIVILNKASIRRRVCNGVIVGPRIDRLLIAATTASLSQWTRSSPFSQLECHSRNAYSTAYISFQLICFFLWRRGTCAENK